MLGDKETSLKRVLGLPQVMFYGLGTILGAGIYVLVGKVAVAAGLFTPVAFLLAGVIAALSALSYAELSSRFPKCSGAALYAEKGLCIRKLSVLVGIAVALSGIISAGVLVHGFAGYFQIFFDLPSEIIIVGILAILMALAIWGMQASAWMISIITFIEVGGLLLVLWGARSQLFRLPEVLPQMLPSFEGGIWIGILTGTFLAFYAFVGFEDMVNLAEETKKPRRVLPLAIIISLAIATVLYLAVSVVVVLGLSPEELATTNAPLALIFEKSTGGSAAIIGVIALFSIINGVIAQMIMASRMLFGMSRKGWIPAVWGLVSTATRTPVVATIWVTLAILVFALFLPIVPLANLTSLITLIIFGLVNLALIRIKLRDGKSADAFQVPLWVPVMGLLANSGIVIHKIVVSVIL